MNTILCQSVSGRHVVLIKTSINIQPRAGVSPFTTSQASSNILGNGIGSLRSPARRHSRGITKCTPRASIATLAAVPAPSSPPAVAVFAVVVGWLVIAGSLFRSVPQISRILKNKSVDGLSLTSTITELVVYLISVSYNLRFQYPFSTWGDVGMVAVQQAAILGLVFHFNKSTPTALKIGTTFALLAISAYLFTDVCSIAALQLMQACSAVLLALGGRLPQIILNIRRGNSGELSSASTGLSVAGNLARVFTTISLVGDPIILATAASQLVLNSILLYQTVVTAQHEKGKGAAIAASTSPVPVTN